MSMMINTCPRCGCDLAGYVLTTNPPINGVSCPRCGWRDEKRTNVIRVPYKPDDRFLEEAGFEL